MKLQRVLPALVLGLAAGQVLACYTVYDRAGRVLYNEESPPVDMSRPLHETLPARFPGSHMVFDTEAACDAITPLAPVNTARTGGTPLLTDRRTAQAMHVPYSVLAGGIALVQPRDARIGPGVTVIPAEALAIAPVPGTGTIEMRDTRVMGGSVRRQGADQ
jgi:hypothetical protein